MHTIGSGDEVPTESARALVVASGRECSACGKTLTDRQRGACSGKCRAKLSRQRHAEALQTEVRGLGRALELLRARHDALAERVDRMTERSRPRSKF